MFLAASSCQHPGLGGLDVGFGMLSVEKLGGFRECKDSALRNPTSEHAGSRELRV